MFKQREKMKALLLSPHTDDIELAAGGTVCQLVNNGYSIHWMVFSACRKSLPDTMPEDRLESEFKNVFSYLQSMAGSGQLSFGMEDYEVRSFSEHRQGILEKLVAIRNSFRPSLVIGPSSADLHQDHAAVSQEMIRCFKNFCSILGFEQPWNHRKSDVNYFRRLSDSELDAKWDMLQCYRSQFELKRPYFDRECIQAMARVNGLKAGCRYAEAFECIRWLD